MRVGCYCPAPPPGMAANFERGRFPVVSASHSHLSAMAKKKSSPQNADYLRIVPLTTTELAQAPAAAVQAAQLVYNNGPLIAQPQVFTIFWGTAWQPATLQTLMADINGFFDYILSSSLIDQLAEYSVSGYQIQYGQRIGTLALTSPDVSQTVDDSDIQQMIQQQISSGNLPASNPNSLYFVFLPSGVTVTLGGSASCQTFCGYHDAIGGQTFYAVTPFPDCSGCTSSLSNFDAITVTTSHELCEAITDPVPGQGWYDTQNGEIGDICAWQTKQVGQYTVQQEWSNQANSCV